MIDKTRDPYSAHERSALPLAVLRLRGTQQQMGEQFGQLTLELGGWEPMLAFYPRMPGYLISSGLPMELRPAVAFACQQALFGPALAMNRYRQRRFPHYYARTVAMARRAGVPLRLARHLMVMDVLQNVVGLVGRLGLLESARLNTSTLGCCTSLAVWGDCSQDGRLLQARNFDFPGAGLWEEAPTVVLCDPDEGVRYGYVSTRGVDLPGVTAFNEAGLTLSAHTRFHRDVSFRATSIVDLGHDIIRRAETLDDAVRVAREHPVASTWGLLVSSARERDALIIETTARATEVHRAPPGQAHLSCTNSYLSPALSTGEVANAAAFMADSEARYAQAERAAAGCRQRQGLDRPALQSLLGSLGDVGAAPGEQEAERMTGCCVTSPVSVTSAITDPDRREIQVSVGKAPTGWGPYVTVPWQWEGPVEAWEVTGETGEAPPNLPPAEVRDTYRQYTDLCREHLACAPPRPLRAAIQRLASEHDHEPHFQFLAAVTRMQQGDLDAARHALRSALGHEGGTYRRAQYLLWLSRVQDASGHPTDAERLRQQLEELTHPQIQEYQLKAGRERTRPYTRRRLRLVAINMLMIDAE